MIVLCFKLFLTMPKQINSDTQAYDKEYDAFLKQLEEFHLQRGTAFKRLPRINGKGIDLYLLYVVVTARGGWQKLGFNVVEVYHNLVGWNEEPRSPTANKAISLRPHFSELIVNSRNEWEEILEDFRLPAACVNASIALKQVYIRYLDTYERINFLGEDLDERTNEGEEDEARSLRVKRSMRAMNLVPLTYNQQQHVVSESVRSNSGLSTDLYKPSIYDRLSLSLSCPLPNEHDFAFNMCTLLSNEGKHTLLFPHCPRIVEFMLAHTGVFRDRETQKYFICNYKEAKGKSLVQFWIDSIEDKSVLDLLSPECYEVAEPIFSNNHKYSKYHKNFSLFDFSKDNSPVPLLGSEDVSCSQYSDSRSEDGRGDLEYNGRVIDIKLEQVFACEGVDLRLEPEDTEIFHLGRDLGLLDSEGTRISQVLHILRNLSFEEVNVNILALSNTCLRFLVLCVCSRWGGLAVGALDTLGNIAADIVLRDPAVDSTSALLLTTLCQGVSSPDRAFVLRSLEVLNKLSLNDPNEEILSCNIDQSVYDQICRFLTIHDIMLLIYTLEALYSLSSMGSCSCNAIVRSKGSVQSLVSLLTVEAQSYGPEACIGMKVVETVTGVVSEADSHAPAVANAPTSATTGVTQNQVSTATSVIVGNTPKIIPKSSVEIKKVSTPRIVPVEVEEFVIEWVRKNYEACPNNAIEQAIVYRHFAASMHAYGRKQGLNPVLLSNCVRRVFGTGVGPSRRPIEDGTEKWHYSGIKRKEGVLMPSVLDKKTVMQNNSNPKPLLPTPIISANTTSPVRIMPAAASSEGASQGSILKAQLSAPLRNNPSPGRVIPHQGIAGGVVGPSVPPPAYSGTQSQMSQQTFPRTDNSSLIKSLLANKVASGTASSQLVSKPILAQTSYQLQQQYQMPELPSHTNVPEQQTLPRSQVHALCKGPLGPQGLVGNPNVSSRIVSPYGPDTIAQSSSGVVQAVRGASKAVLENPTSGSEQGSKAVFNGLVNETSEIPESKKVTSFEGILQNGLMEECVEQKEKKDTQFEKKNLLADLLEKTVGGDVLNGVVEKDLRITEKGIQIVSHTPYVRINGPSNGQLETYGSGIKRPATPDVQGSPTKRLAVEDLRSDSRITLYVSQNGSDGEVLSQGHQVILNQGHQVVTAASLSGGQAVVTAQGQMIIQRPSQSNVLMQQTPQILSHIPSGQIISSQRSSQVITHTSQSQQTSTVLSHVGSGQTQVIPTHGTQMITTSSGQVIQQVIAHGQGGQKVILHSGQLGQVLSGQVILPQGSGQNIFLQSGNSLPGQVIMQSVATNNQTPVIVQGSNGHSQVLVQSTNQGQVLLPASTNQGQLVVSQGQTVMSPCTQGQVVVTTTCGQPLIVTGTQGQQVLVSSGQTGPMLMSGSSSQGHGQMLVQSGPVGNAVFLAPQQGGSGPQKTLIILPNHKMVVSGNQPQTGPVVLPRQVVQVVSSPNTPPSTSNPVRAVKNSPSVTETHSNTYNINVSVPVQSGMAPPPSGPTATPVTQVSHTVQPPHIPAPQVLSSGIARRPKQLGLQYLCEWRGCKQVFSSPNQVYHHACKIHCPPSISELVCQWNGCDTMVRKRFSAMTHIHDRHCNEQLLQILALRRQQIANTGKTEIPVPQTPPPHPGYAPNAAFHAIKRHALEVINQRDAVEKEGPVTKSIRLTAALILRNLVIYSNSGRKLLRGYESQLANVAISSMESSRTVGQMLYDIHLPDHQAL